ncbi:MAG: phage late control D family protein [Sporomusaceae bacterium]|jgi:hypothetical protein|nr:phage late control D family protein [Sporomusaceae bacterium]
MSSLPIKGINDIQSVADFSQAAEKLGLGEDGQKLQTLVCSLEENGALAPGGLNETAIAQTVEQMTAAGVLPPVLSDPQQVTKLAEGAKNLGLESTNIDTLVPAVMDKAKALGLIGGGERSDQGAVPINRLHFAPYDFKDIQKLKISQDINEHARLFICGTLPEASAGQNYVQRTDEFTAAALHYIDGTMSPQCIFRGIVTGIRQETRAEVTYLEIEAVSASFLLDIKKHSRPFQCETKTYSHIFEKVNALAKEYIEGLTGDIVAAGSKEADTELKKFILQYHETEWEFLKRLASHFNLGLFPDVVSEMPQVHFGLPPKKETPMIDGSKPLTAVAYKMRRNNQTYSIATANKRQNSGAAFKPEDFTYYEATSYNIFSLGQTVDFLQKEFYIAKIETYMTQGLVESIYTLATEQGLMQNDLYNHKIVGMSLPCIVEKIDKDTVRVHFERNEATWVPEEWDEGNDTWKFPYTTVYSSPDGTGWYCMPEEQDRVRVYFPTNQEKDAVAASSINPINEDRGGRDDPDQKTISTVHGKKIILTPNGIDIFAMDLDDKENIKLISLDDEKGLFIFSKKKLILEGEEIEFKGTSTIKIDSGKEITLTQGNDQIIVGSSKIEVKTASFNMQ